MRRFIVATPLLLVAITAMDSSAVAAHSRLGQPLAAACTLLFWGAMVWSAQPRLRRLMLLGLIAATAGELIFSIGLGMYTYRLASVPIYVPPGHTILYAAIFLFVRRPWPRRHSRWLAPLLMAGCAAYTAFWYRQTNDRYGLYCFAAFALLWLVHRGARLFFASMYLLVAFLEQWGTHFGCWRWPALLFNRVVSCPSGNPPAGVAVFYVLFDLSCIALYFGTNWRSFERWVQRLVFLRSRAPSGRLAR